MKLVYTDRVLGRLHQLFSEIDASGSFAYYDRLRAFRDYCEGTTMLAYCLSQLPEGTYDFEVDWRDAPDQLRPGEEGYGIRWNAICQMVNSGRGRVGTAGLQMGGGHESEGLDRITRVFVCPIYNYLLHQLEGSRSMVYILLRYKRWAEWFEAERLRALHAADTGRGEKVLDSDLRRFLFESGIDYPFSQPDSPGGRADIVAQLDTDDPLVLEVKIWDSDRGYRENRVCDGLRQVMDYADKYGKDRGYVVVFNLDRHPLEFVSPENTDEWPPRMQVSGKTYSFIDVSIGEQEKPVSQRDKGKPVETQRIVLADLLKEPSGA